MQGQGHSSRKPQEDDIPTPPPVDNCISEVSEDSEDYTDSSAKDVSKNREAQSQVNSDSADVEGNGDKSESSTPKDNPSLASLRNAFLDPELIQ